MRQAQSLGGVDHVHAGRFARAFHVLAAYGLDDGGVFLQHGAHLVGVARLVAACDAGGGDRNWLTKVSVVRKYGLPVACAMLR